MFVYINKNISIPIAALVYLTIITNYKVSIHHMIPLLNFYHLFHEHDIILVIHHVFYLRSNQKFPFLIIQNFLY